MRDLYTIPPRYLPWRQSPLSMQTGPITSYFVTWGTHSQTHCSQGTKQFFLQPLLFCLGVYATQLYGPLRWSSIFYPGPTHPVSPSSVDWLSLRLPPVPLLSPYRGRGSGWGASGNTFLPPTLPYQFFYFHYSKLMCLHQITISQACPIMEITGTLVKITNFRTFFSGEWSTNLCSGPALG